MGAVSFVIILCFKLWLLLPIPWVETHENQLYAGTPLLRALSWHMLSPPMHSMWSCCHVGVRSLWEPARYIGGILDGRSGWTLRSWVLDLTLRIAVGKKPSVKNWMREASNLDYQLSFAQQIKWYRANTFYILKAKRASLNLGHC